MKANEIRIGETYRARVSGKDARVKITAERTNYNGRRYWLGQNLATKREVTIRGAARLHPILDLKRWFMVLGDGRKVATWATDEDAARAKAVKLGHTVTAIATTAADAARGVGAMLRATAGCGAAEGDGSADGGRSGVEPYYQDDAVTLYHGDCREILPEIPAVTAIFTDPPYSRQFISLYGDLGRHAVRLLPGGGHNDPRSQGSWPQGHRYRD